MENSNNENDLECPKSNPRTAAIYVRMSTEHQNYSIENQVAEMQKYAEANNLEIIETYSDGAKSGLVAKNRKELQRLLRDAQQGLNKYSVLLIYDVTRFGRYQNSDQAAAYEYMCVEAGIEVIYIAEDFHNDGSMGSRIQKALKREMAGGYSKDLSSKVHIGQCRLIGHGFRQGGPAGYGLRRMLIDENRNEKGMLEIGQQKSIQTDRVILVPGPEEEIKIVNEIYEKFVNEEQSERCLTKYLNDKGIKTDFGRPWTHSTVHQVLTNEKYIGNNVYNRRSFKLKMKRVVNPPDAWVRADGAFKGIVDQKLFYTAQGIIRERNRRFSNEEMIDHLKHLYERHGYLSGIIIDEADSIPSSGAYSHRFGSLIRAYELVGFKPDRDYSYIEINRVLRQYHQDTVAETIEIIETLGGNIHRNPTSDLLTINNEITASIVIARCQQTKAGSLRWQIRLDTGLNPDITVAIRMDSANKHPLDYYLLPQHDMTSDKLRLSEDNGIVLDAYRFDTLEFFHCMAERTKVTEIAA